MGLTAKKVYAVLNRKIKKISGDVSSLGTPLFYAGSVTTADLLPASPKLGAVYNIEQKSIYGEPGTNVVWNGVLWDPLGTTFDLSLLLTKENAKNLYLQKNQGSENSGKFLVVGEDGNVILSDTQDGGVKTDTTLTKSGEAADAKVVGDKITTLKEDLTGFSVKKERLIVEQKNYISTELVSGYISPDGIEYGGSNYKRTAKITCKSGDKLTCDKVIYTAMPYKGSVAMTDKVLINYMAYESIPEGADSIILSFNNDKIGDSVTITHEHKTLVCSTDETLSQSGKMADAKAVGDLLPRQTANKLPNESYQQGIFLHVANDRIYENKNESYDSTDVIEVEIGHTYKLISDYDINISLFPVEFMDGNQKAGVTKLDSLKLNSSFKATKNNIRFSYDSIARDILNHYALVDTSITESFVPYGKIMDDSILLSKNQIRQTNEIIDSANHKPLYGKKILSLGDSYTYLNYYGKYLEKVTGATQRGRGQNGNFLKSFCNDTYSGHNAEPVSELFDSKLLEQYDIVTVMGGTNDYGHGTTTLGTIDDSKENNTIYGSVKYIIDKILSIKPSVKIVFCTQPYRLQYSTELAPGGYEQNENGLTMESIANAIVDCCNHYGIPCFDFYHCSNWNTWTVKKENGKLVENIYTYDGLHPKDGNGNGADLLGTALGNYINRLYGQK